MAAGRDDSDCDTGSNGPVALLAKTFLIQMTARSVCRRLRGGLDRREVPSGNEMDPANSAHCTGDGGIDGDREANDLFGLITSLYAFSAVLTRTCSSTIARRCFGVHHKIDSHLHARNSNPRTLSISGCRPAFRSCNPGVNAGGCLAARNEWTSDQ